MTTHDARLNLKTFTNVCKENSINQGQEASFEYKAEYEVPHVSLSLVINARGGVPEDVT